ncbi:MAG TPA: CBS domain-containing protein [Gammaproteobacteria bacterium]|nr:CBS domain-containing protein [Gammaproteobacteria bacterium]
MSIPYRNLPLSLVRSGAHLVRSAHELPSDVTPAHPAFDAMTDLRHVTPAAIELDASLNKAEERMKHTQVRLLFVLDEARRLLGLVTLNDIHGERPLRVQRDLGVTHAELRVKDIMTPVGQLETLSMRDVEDARIGDIILTLKRSGRQHMLVVERTAEGDAVRGIFSSTRIGRQLGTRLDTTGIASTFAELEAALGH